MSTTRNADDTRLCPGLQQKGDEMRTVSLDEPRKLPLRPGICRVCFPGADALEDLQADADVEAVRVGRGNSQKTLHAVDAPVEQPADAGGGLVGVCPSLRMVGSAQLQRRPRPLFPSGDDPTPCGHCFDEHDPKPDQVLVVDSDTAARYHDPEQAPPGAPQGGDDR